VLAPPRLAGFVAQEEHERELAQDRLDRRRLRTGQQVVEVPPQVPEPLGLRGGEHQLPGGVEVVGAWPPVGDPEHDGVRRPVLLPQERQPGGEPPALGIP
jgi:hypothetical protein